FRPLAPPFSGIDDEPVAFLGRWLALGKMVGAPLGEGAQLIEGGSEDGQQALPPRVDPWLSQVAQFTHEDLLRLELEVHHKEQRPLFREVQHTPTAPAGQSLAGMACQRLIRGAQPLIGVAESCQELVKLLDRQPCAGQEPTPILSKFW